MAFKNSCFISYPHNAGKSVDAFVDRLKLELADHLAQFVSNPIRTDHDFGTGVEFHPAIANEICESACLLVVYVPIYQRKAFCLREYAAMEELQAKRYAALQRNLSAQFGMILPLVFTGSEDKIPDWIKTHINYKDISKSTIAGPLAVFDTDDFKAWLGKIANMVDDLFDAFQGSPIHPCASCATYALPDETADVVKSRLKVPDAATESFR
jgi:hypothetical protein